MNAPQIHVRRAGAGDEEVLHSLIDALADFENLSRPNAAARERLVKDTFDNHPRIEVYLAEVNKKVVAYAIVFETYSSFLALPNLYLEDIFVLAEYRGSGVGYHLFKYCVNESFRRGCGRMEWMVLDWNQSAISFYERLGARRLKEWIPYRLTREEMKIVLEGNSSD